VPIHKFIINRIQRGAMAHFSNFFGDDPYFNAFAPLKQVSLRALEVNMGLSH